MPQHLNVITSSLKLQTLWWFFNLPNSACSCDVLHLFFIFAGVSYLSKTQEDEARLQLNQHVAFKDSSCACSRNSTSTSDFVFCERFRMELEKWTNKIKINNVNNNVKNILHMHIVKEASTFRIRDEPNLACYTTPQSDALSKYPNFTAELDNHHQVCLARGVIFYLQNFITSEHFKSITGY